MGLESCNAVLENKHRIICVEGEFDWLRVQAEALKLHEATAELVCFGGSDIKKEKLETLKKAGAELLYLSFDPDTAGKKATRDTIKYSEELDLCCFIMELPEGYDPYEYIKTYGLPAYQKLFKSASKPSEWLAKEFLSKYILNTKEGLERAKIALLEEAKQYKGLILEAFLEETTKELKQDKNYILELVKKQQQESAKGIALFTLKSFLPDAPVNEDFLIPVGWALDNQGLTKIKETKDDILEIPITKAPFFVSSRSENIDTKQEKLEITYLRNEKWKTIYEERAILLDHRKIVQLAGIGFPVTSLNCKEIVHFISDFEGINDKIFPKQSNISNFGWKKEKDTLYFVLPQKAYGTNIPVVFEPEGLGEQRLAKALKPKGNIKEWIKAIRRLIDYPRAMFQLYASLTPPLLEIIDAPNFIIDNWGLTSIGKTTVMSIAASVWGLPIKEQGGIILPWDATKVAIERLATFFNHLAIFLDDSQTANERIIKDILYMIANGGGRSRGAIKGSQKTSFWRTIAFSTGEQPLNQVTEFEGAKARIISLYGSPFGEKKQSELIHKVKPAINSNYGHAGPRFIEELIFRGYNKSNELLQKEYDYIAAKLAKLGKDNVADRMSRYLAAVQVAAQIAEEIFDFGGEPENIVVTASFILTSVSRIKLTEIPVKIIV